MKMTQLIRLVPSCIMLILISIISVSKLLVRPNLMIQIEGDAFKFIEIPYSYTTKDAYILLLLGLFAGIFLSQILLILKEPVYELINVRKTENAEIITQNEACPNNHNNFNVLLRALEGDERKVIKTILENDGEILQNELVNILDFSKAKVSRILTNLEQRNIITKRQQGMTNHISLAEDIRGEIK